VKPLPHWKRSWPDPSEDLPVDILPASNGEYAPREPTQRELDMMSLANAETERWRRKFGMSRRAFVRTAAATAIGFWAIRSEEHTSELQSRENLVCRLLLEKKKKTYKKLLC